MNDTYEPTALAATKTLTGAKAKLEREILQLLVTFVAETGLVIDRIELETATTLGSNVAWRPVKVTVGVEL